MAEARQLLPGFNHNVRHAGKLYHVQTEDSGTANPHITTHLFLGGNVIASERSSYADEVGLGDLAERVRRMMQAQHKEMLRRVVRGAFDDAVTGRSFQPGELSLGEGEAAPPAASPAPPQVAASAPAAIAEVGPPAAASAPAAPAPDAGRAATPPPVVPRAPTPPPVARPPAAARPPPAPPRSAPAAPPPRPAPAPPQRAAAPAPPPRNGRVDGWGPPMLSRATRPADAPPAAPAAQADRRLDELILSYLAEDLGSKRER
jgi:hypothetical protein